MGLVTPDLAESPPARAEAPAPAAASAPAWPLGPEVLARHGERPYEHRSQIDLDLRVDDTSSPVILGHAAMFNVQYELFADFGWRFLEQVAPGAFAKTIREHDVRALWNHDVNFVLGRNKAKTLRLWEDERGLAYEIKAPETDTVRDLVLAPMRRGDVTQSSFGFQVIKERFEEDREAKTSLRTILEAKLWDVSPVTFPASPSTDAAVRSILSEAGLDLEGLTSALLRTRAGLPLACEDSACLRSAVDALQSRIAAEPAASSGSHLADQRRRELALYQMLFDPPDEAGGVGAMSRSTHSGLQGPAATEGEHVN